ncbi:MAG: hypothetical protein AAGH74_07925 [Pseudomonadota bacterium]
MNMFGGKPSYHSIDPRFRDQVIRTGFDYKLLFGCRIKVLMVTDGSDFDDGSGYHLSEVIKAITDDLPSYLTIEIKTAEHHSGSASGADYSNLNLANHNLSQYDQIWFFAVSPSTTSGLTDAEVSAVWEFMQGGGGIFATGDHEALGVALCGKLPRVRSMRRWWYDYSDTSNLTPGPNNEPRAPSRSGSDRHNTTIGTDFDGTPQTIVPKKYYAPHPYIFRTKVFPHPVLCGPEGPITVLPDHMHEGAIEVPPLNQHVPVGGNEVKEYPDSAGSPLAPEVIATATNHVTNQPFGVIGAYDGHLVDEIEDGVGRIVVDATWHHFFNTNLNQFRSGFEAVQTALANGTTPSAADIQLADYYRPMRAYFQNIAVWLARAKTQDCIRRRGLWFVRWHLDVQMALLPDPYLPVRIDERWIHYWDLGTKARDAFQRLAPQCQSLELILWVVQKTQYAELLNPWWEREIRIRDDKLAEEPFASFLDPEAIGLVALGGAMQAIGTEIGEKMDESIIDDGRLDKVAQYGAQQALATMGGIMEQDMKILQRTAE